MDPNLNPTFFPPSYLPALPPSALPSPFAPLPSQTNSAAHVLSGLSRPPAPAPQQPMYEPDGGGANDASASEDEPEDDDSGDEFHPDDPYGAERSAGRRASGGSSRAKKNGHQNGNGNGNGRAKRPRAAPMRYDEASGDEGEGEAEAGEESFEAERDPAEAAFVGGDDGGLAQAGGDEHEPLYVNAKQYHRILKRRMARARLEEMGRLSRQRKVSSVASASRHRVAADPCFRSLPRPYHSCYPLHPSLSRTCTNRATSTRCAARAGPAAAS